MCNKSANGISENTQCMHTDPREVSAAECWFCAKFLFPTHQQYILETLQAAYLLRGLASSLKSNEGKERLWPPSHLSAVDAGSLGKSQAQSYRRRCLHYSRTPLECFYKMTILFFTHFPLSQIDRITG